MVPHELEGIGGVHEQLVRRTKGRARHVVAHVVRAGQSNPVGISDALLARGTAEVIPKPKSVGTTSGKGSVESKIATSSAATWGEGEAERRDYVRAVTIRNVVLFRYRPAPSY